MLGALGALGALANGQWLSVDKGAPQQCKPRNQRATALPQYTLVVRSMALCSICGLLVVVRIPESKPSTGLGRATVGSGKLPSCASVTSLPKAGISPLFQSLRCQPHLVCVCVSSAHRVAFRWACARLQADGSVVHGSMWGVGRRGRAVTSVATRCLCSVRWSCPLAHDVE